MDNLKVGIIGLGGIARSHCDAIETLNNVEIVAVADLIEEKRREYMGKYDIPKSYTSHTDLLKDPEIDAVAITLGHQLHHRLTVDACNAGKHVLVEKPMAINLEQCDNMIAAAADNGVKLMVGLTQHYYGTSIKAKEILNSGALGPVITAVCYMSKNWNYAGRRPQYRSRYHGGGMWLTNGVHVVDRLTWMIGSQAVSVSAAIGTRAHYQAADDSATAFVRYKNGLAGIAIAVGFADGAPDYECQVICANGTLRFTEHGGKYVKVGKNDQWENVPFDEPPSTMHNEWKAFAEAIALDIEPPTHGEWARHIMEILFAAEQSAITGREVALESGPGLVQPAFWLARDNATRLDMKILFVAQYGPLAASSRTRVFDYLPLLRRAGVICTVRVITPDDLVKRNVRGIFSRLLYYVLSYFRALWTGWACVFTASQYDAILIQKALFSFPIPRLLRRYKHKIFFDFDDAIFTLENPNESWINRLRTRRRAMSVPAMLQIAHCAIVENAYTAEFAARYCPYISQITGPIDTARYVPRKKTTGEKILLGWIGSQWTTRYLDLIRDPLITLSRQYPNLELHLIGAGDFDVPDLRIARLDWALETEVDHLQTFDIGLMPLPDDPFTRGKGGYKLLQYMACGLPVVASPVEINCEIVTHGETGFLAETDTEWIEFLGTLIKNKTLRNRLGTAGRARVIAHYALEKSSEQLLALLQRSIHQCDTLSQ